MSKYAYIEDMATWRDEFSFSIDVHIRFSETDMFGHMNNVSVFTYFEEARIEFMKHIDLFKIKGNHDEVPIVADLQCDYHAQVFFDETIQLYVKAAELGRSSIDLHYMAVKKDGTICFTGRGKLVKVNVSTGKSTPLTETEKSKLTMSAVLD